MNSLIQLAGKLVLCGEEDPDQPLRCRAALAMREAADEIKGLREIVDKVIKTADGVPVVLEMKVWCRTIARGWVPNTVLGMFMRERICWLDMAVGAKLLPAECYSTLEAAEAKEK